MMTDIKTMKITAEQLESLSEVNRISALKIGEMQAEINELKSALRPFTEISEKADYSYGEIRSLDIMFARSLLEKE